MPCRPSQVEKLTNHTAKPTTSPSSSATRHDAFGDSPNRAERTSSSVATTASGSRSYVASSRTSETMTGTSSTVASRINGVPVVVQLEWPSSGLLRLPEDLVDLGDLLQQLLGLAGVDGALAAGCAGQLRGLVEQLVQVGVLLEVRRLEVVGPQHPQVVLHELGPLLLDEQRPGAEDGVLVALVLLADGLDRLGLDARLRRVVDAAGQVTVSRDGDARLKQSTQHVVLLRSRCVLASDTIAVRSPLRRVLVTGPAMAPAIRHGDQLLVDVRPVRRPTRVGDVVVVRLPERPLSVKRVVRVEGSGGVWVEGDNPFGSTDSRDLGAVPSVDVVGRVLVRLWPRPGRIQRAPSRPAAD